MKNRLKSLLLDSASFPRTVQNAIARLTTENSFQDINYRAMPKTIITRNPQKPLFMRSAEEFRLKTEPFGSLSELSLNERGLWFAELSMYTHLAQEQFEKLIGEMGWSVTANFNCQHGAAYLVESNTDLVVVIRGSSERDWDEIQKDDRKKSGFSETVGKVNRLFKADSDSLWPLIEKGLEANRKPLWFCGHSVGGALASICAQRSLLSYIRSEPEEVHTFGAPRVGDKKYVSHVELKHYRWVNNNDYVTQLPLPIFGYRHSGDEMYLNRQGELTKVPMWRKVIDRGLGFLGGLIKGKIDQLEDHEIVQYVERIFALVRRENRPRNQAPVKHESSQAADVSSSVPQAKSSLERKHSAVMHA